MASSTGRPTNRSDAAPAGELDQALRLQVSSRAATRAAYAMIFAIFADALNLQCCAPNYPAMMSGVHEDSFPSIAPLGLATAQYVLTAAISLGAILSNFVFGHLMGRVGAKSAVIVLLVGSVVFTVGKYFGRHSYWLFLALSFANGKSIPSVLWARDFQLDSQLAPDKSHHRRFFWGNVVGGSGLHGHYVQK